MSQETLTQIVGIMLQWSADNNQVFIDKLSSDQQEETALHESQATHFRASWNKEVNDVAARAKEEKEHLENQLSKLTLEIDSYRHQIAQMSAEIEKREIQYTQHIDSLNLQLEMMRLDRRGQNNPAT